MNLKIKITLENKRLLKLHSIIKTKIWCAECQGERDFVSENEIKDFLNEDNKPHKILTTDGTALICLESVSKINPE